MDLLSISFLGTGLLFVLLGLPMWRSMVGPNSFYGVRLPSTLNDPEVWYEVNARSGLDMVWLGCATGLCPLALSVTELHPGERALWSSGVLLIGSLILLARALRHASRLKSKK